MRESIELLRNESRARVYFAALAQSSLGTGAAAVGLMLLAYDRFGSAWAIGLVLLADLVPAMLLGPLFGAIADRWSRKWCTVIADLLRAVAFGGIVFVDSFEATLAFALLAGVGTALFTPAALASLPSLVGESRLPAATSVYGAINDLGFTVGPALAGAVLIAGGAEELMALNAITFVLSAIALAALRFGAAADRSAIDLDGHPSLLAEAREGLKVVIRMSQLRVVLVASATALFFAGLFNVAELPLATEEIGVGDSGFAALVTFYGLGFIVGSLTGASGGEPPELKRKYLIGLLVFALGFLACGLAPAVEIALGAFALTGFGNGLMLVYERLLIQATVPDGLSGRVFGIKDALTAWAFALAFLSAGGLIAVLGTRELVLLAGVGGLAVWASSALALRRAWAARAVVSPRSRRTIGLRGPGADPM